MVSDSDPTQDQDIDLPEGTSFVPKTPSEEELREAKYERLETNLKPVEEVEDARANELDIGGKNRLAARFRKSKRRTHVIERLFNLWVGTNL